jgi:hypothetical protein
VDHVDPRDAGVDHQRGPLVGALSAADDQHPASGQVVEVDHVARVRPPVGRQLADPVRLDAERRDARRGDDGIRLDRVPVVERRPESAVVVALDGLHANLGHVEPLLRAEPVRVVQKHADRHGIDVGRGDAAFLQVGPEGVNGGGVEVPVDARPQEHPRGHVLPPEPHRSSDDRGVDPPVARVGRRGHAVGAGADHQQLRASHG